MVAFQYLVYPGLYFMVFGLRWTYKVLMRYYLGRRETSLGTMKPRQFTSSILFPSSCRPGAPIEAFILLAAVMLEFIGELVMDLGRFRVLVDGQHMTSLFFIAALTVAMLAEYRIVTMVNLDYAALALAFLVKGFWFHYDSLGAGPLQTQLHQNVVLLCVVIAVFLSLEATFPHNVIVPLIRTSSVTLLGSWLFGMAVILHFPFSELPWDLRGGGDLELVTLMYLWHVAGIILLVFSLTSFVVYRVRKLAPTQVHEALDVTYFKFGPNQSCKHLGKPNKYLMVHSDGEDV